MKIIDKENNPIFMFYTISGGEDKIFYLICLQSDSYSENWKITYHDLLPEEIKNDSSFNCFKLNEKNEKWYYISA